MGGHGTAPIIPMPQQGGKKVLAGSANRPTQPAPRNINVDYRVRGRPQLPTGRSARVLERTAATWVKFTSSGECTTVSANRQKVINQLGLQPRDVRILEPQLAFSYPSAILCRGKAIVVSLEHIKCIISTKYALIMNAEDEAVVPFMEKLKSRLSNGGSNGMPVYGESTANLLQKCALEVSVPGDGGLPFELRVLEICLEEVCQKLEREVNDLEGSAQIALDSLLKKVTPVNLERERKLKNRLNRLKVNVETIKEVLEKYLDDDSDMQDLNLTAKLEAETRDMAPARDDAMRSTDVVQGETSANAEAAEHSSSASSDTSSDSDDHEDVEMLLQTYFMSIDNTYNRIQQLSENIDDTEDYVNIDLDSKRNVLISIQLLLTGGAVALSLITCIGGIFGTNLNSNIQDSYPIFLEVVIITCVLCVLGFIAFVAWIKYKRLLFF